MYPRTCPCDTGLHAPNNQRTERLNIKYQIPTLVRGLEAFKEIAAHNGTDALPKLHDHFIEEGPQGKHPFLVPDLYNTSVLPLRTVPPIRRCLLISNCTLCASSIRVRQFHF